MRSSQRRATLFFPFQPNPGCRGSHHSGVPWRDFSRKNAKKPPGAHQVQWVTDQLCLDGKVKSSLELYPTEPAATDQVKPSVELPEELVEAGVWSVALPVDAGDDPHHQALHVLGQEGHQLALDEVILQRGASLNFVVM